MSTYSWRIAVALVIAVVLPSCVSGMVTSIGESCFGLRNIYGMRIANDSKGVYETAVSGMFEGLDKALDGVTLH